MPESVLFESSVLEFAVEVAVVVAVAEDEVSLKDDPKAVTLWIVRGLAGDSVAS